MKKSAIVVAMITITIVTLFCLSPSAFAECEGDVIVCPLCYYEKCNPTTCVCRCVYDLVVCPPVGVSLVSSQSTTTANITTITSLESLKAAIFEGGRLDTQE